MNWQSTGISEFITAANVLVGDVAKQLQTIQNNVKSIQQILKKWAALPLTAKEKTDKLDKTEDRLAYVMLKPEDVKTAIQVFTLFDVSFIICVRIALWLSVIKDVNFIDCSVIVIES